MTPRELEAAGLGLRYGTVRLVPARPEWQGCAAALAAQAQAALGIAAADVAHVGSTAVTEMLAKPILDLAVRLVPDASTETTIRALEAAGYIYRGDAGGDGGLVFVLDVEPWVRVAHLHVVRDGDPQWDRYLAFVAVLRENASAREAYEAAKRELALAHPDGRKAYTLGKSDILSRLLAPGVEVGSR